jgi:hypothetical protein
MKTGKVHREGRISRDPKGVVLVSPVFDKGDVGMAYSYGSFVHTVSLPLPLTVVSLDMASSLALYVALNCLKLA